MWNPFQQLPVAESLGNKLWEGVGKGLDYLINDVILEGAGNLISAGVSAVSRAPGAIMGAMTGNPMPSGGMTYDPHHIFSGPAPELSRGQTISGPVIEPTVAPELPEHIRTMAMNAVSGINATVAAAMSASTQSLSNANLSALAPTNTANLAGQGQIQGLA